MRTKLLAVMTVDAVLLLAGAVPALAHHAFGGSSIRTGLCCSGVKW